MTCQNGSKITFLYKRVVTVMLLNHLKLRVITPIPSKKVLPSKKVKGSVSLDRPRDREIFRLKVQLQYEIITGRKPNVHRLTAT